MEAYGSFDRLVDAFRDFADRVPFYGAVVVCDDDPAVRSMTPRLSRRTIRYGFGEGVDVRGIQPVSDAAGARCRVQHRNFGPDGGWHEGDIDLPVPGRHNLLNALAAVSVGLELGVPFDRIRSALAEFRGAERRYQTRGTVHGVSVVDDYGHHPTEIAAVLQAARDGHPARVIAVFQPHRFSRTRDLLHDFGPALAGADVVVLTDIYPAGEAAIEGITVDALAEAMRPGLSELHLVRDLADVPARVAALARPGDLVVTFGAGSIAATGDRILTALEQREATR
jgi:UDP-N-acetylmuramate--alanine ligase